MSVRLVGGILRQTETLSNRSRSSRTLDGFSAKIQHFPL
jgi:hypothetical protein